MHDLARVTVRWLQGNVEFTPTHDSPDPETAVIHESLVKINTAGFMTEFSQPAELYLSGGQRAAVSGFCEQSLAERIQSLLLPVEVLVLAWPPDYGGVAEVPITMSHDEAYTWCGSALDPENIEYMYGNACHPEAVRALHEAWQVAVIDMKWGRNELLWPALVAAVEDS